MLTCLDSPLFCLTLGIYRKIHPIDARREKVVPEKLLLEAHWGIHLLQRIAGAILWWFAVKYFQGGLKSPPFQVYHSISLSILPCKNHYYQGTEDHNCPKQYGLFHVFSDSVSRPVFWLRILWVFRGDQPATKSIGTKRRIHLPTWVCLLVEDSSNM